MSAPTQFRKKPVVISAIQWTGENLVDVIHFTDGRPPNNKSSHAGMMWDQYVDVVRKDGLKIFTMEGKMDASIGDWIIKGVKGEHYPCKPEIFALTYDDASASTDLSQAAVAAALSAAASELDGELSEESTALLGAWAVEWAKQATSVQDHIRALITQPQHDALAAHVAAEVAKARAEEAAVLDASDEVKAYLDGVIGVVEANSFESMCLWMQAKESARSWIPTGHGYGPMIGRINTRPVCLSIMTATVDGHKIVFIDATSDVYDWKLIDAWLQKNLPQSAMHEDGRINKTDAMNFENVFPRAQIGAKP